MKLADMHTHTPLCGHAAGEAEAYAEQAIRSGLSFYGASDHFPLPPGYPEYDSMHFEQWPTYKNDWIRRLKCVLEPVGITVLFGTEFDYLPGDMAQTRPAMDAEDLDYRISSVHFLDHLAVDNIDEIPVWNKYSIDETWAMYTETMSRMVSEGNFEILGHLDLPKKYGYFPSDKKKQLLDFHDILKTAANKGICMELNTTGWRKPVRQLYPSDEIIRLAFDVGVRITLGSDSHAPCEIGKDFDRAIQAAKAAGYRCACTFQKKQCIELPFD